MSAERPDVAHQASFSADGAVEVEGSTETDLCDWGAEVGRETETRTEKARASEFGVDDRPEVEERDAGEQEALFVGGDEAQKTLDGGQSGQRCTFE